MYVLEAAIYGTVVTETIEDINALCERIDFFKVVDSSVIAVAKINESVKSCVYLYERSSGVICNKLK